MSSAALANLQNVIYSGLIRKAAVIPDRWASRYMQIEDPKTGVLGPNSYRYHPWTLEMVNTDKSWVGPKAAQVAYTHTALTRALFLIDVRKRSVLYLLPKKTPDATDFSKSRFDPLIDQSPHLATVFTDVNNIGHKQAGPAALFIRGMRSRSGVKSLPVGCVIFDEYDEMPIANIVQAEQRMAGKFYKQSIKISTPTVPKKLIDKEYRRTTQEHYFFRCPRCSRFTEFDFPDALVLYTEDPSDDEGLARSHYRCQLCRNPIYHEEKSEFLTIDGCEWRPTGRANALVRGFHVNQFYSFTESPATIGRIALLARDDPAYEQDYWNSCGGLPRIPDGSGVTDDHLIRVIDPDYVNGGAAPSLGRIRTMGVDIGKRIHVEVDEWTIPNATGADLNTRALCRNLLHTTVEQFEELDSFMRLWQIHMCVVDMNPERRKAQEFANRFYGHVWMCLYGPEVQDKDIVQKPDERIIRVHRTNWLDISLGRFYRGSIVLPRDTQPEYKDNIQSIVKRYMLDTTGNRVARYINVDPDHYAHARNYAEIALPLALSLTENKDVTDFL